MSTLQQQLEEHRDARLRFAYLFLTALGLPRLAVRMGMTLRPWYLEQQRLDKERQT